MLLSLKGSKCEEPGEEDVGGATTGACDTDSGIRAQDKYILKWEVTVFTTAGFTRRTLGYIREIEFLDNFIDYLKTLCCRTIYYIIA